MKKFFCYIIILFISFSCSAQKSLFPEWDVFTKLNELTTQYNTIFESTSNKPTVSTVQQLLNLNDRIDVMIDSTWPVPYLGFMKRVEANVCFLTAETFTKLPGFFDNKNNMQLALKKINKGFESLQNFSRAPYQAYLTTNSDGTERRTIEVDEGRPMRNRGQIELQNGQDSLALNDFLNSYKNTYTIYGQQMQLETKHYPFLMATLITQLSKNQNKYDERTVNFCIGILEEGEYPDSMLLAQGKTVEQINYWHDLRPLIYKTLDGIAAHGPRVQYYIPFPQASRANKYEWFILALSKLDAADMLQTLDLSRERSKDNLGNRFTMVLTAYCGGIISRNDNPEAVAASEAILQKHFRDRVDVGEEWYHYFDGPDCSEIKWLADRMDKYPIDGDERKWIEKGMKKCKKYLK
ncbi:MAG: hypothetical protein ABI091_25575 [Ferruginibacter sp.]